MRYRSLWESRDPSTPGLETPLSTEAANPRAAEHPGTLRGILKP